MDDHHNDEVCDTNLQLGLVHGYDVPKRDNQQKRKHVFFLDLSVPQQSDDECTGTTGDSSSSLKVLGADNHDENEKRKNGICYGIDGEAVGNGNCFKNISTKKLRLTRDQTTLLEDSFKQRSTPNTVKKQELAEKLNLKPRQVEVWFQNRRARTKMKQTELDCKVLKKNCERLAAENRRLKEELLELKSAMKIEDPSHAAGCAAVFLKT